MLLIIIEVTDTSYFAVHCYSIHLLLSVDMELGPVLHLVLYIDAHIAFLM